MKDQRSFLRVDRSLRKRAVVGPISAEGLRPRPLRPPCYPIDSGGVGPVDNFSPDFYSTIVLVFAFVDDAATTVQDGLNNIGCLI